MQIWKLNAVRINYQKRYRKKRHNENNNFAMTVVISFSNASEKKKRLYSNHGLLWLLWAHSNVSIFKKRLPHLNFLRQKGSPEKLKRKKVRQRGSNHGDALHESDVLSLHQIPVREPWQTSAIVLIQSLYCTAARVAKPYKVQYVYKRWSKIDYRPF